MKNLVLLAAVLALACAGCVTQKKVTVAKDGTQTTQQASGFLVTIQGYSDQTVSPDGVISSTSFQNLTGDVQMVLAIDQLIKDVATTALMASGNTNIVNSAGTNGLAGVFYPGPRLALRRASR